MYHPPPGINTVEQPALPQSPAKTLSFYPAINNFDVVIVDGTLLINRVTAFELLAEIDEQVREAAVENTGVLEHTLPFVEFDGIREYVGGHKRTARIVALRTRQDLPATSLKNLQKECKRSGVQAPMEDSKVVPEPARAGLLAATERS